jgi:hypothetical protein
MVSARSTTTRSRPTAHRLDTHLSRACHVDLANRVGEQPQFAQHAEVGDPVLAPLERRAYCRDVPLTGPCLDRPRRLPPPAYNDSQSSPEGHNLRR